MIKHIFAIFENGTLLPIRYIFLCVKFRKIVEFGQVQSYVFQKIKRFFWKFLFNFRFFFNKESAGFKKVFTFFGRFKIKVNRNGGPIAILHTTCHVAGSFPQKSLHSNNQHQKAVNSCLIVQN